MKQFIDKLIERLEEEKKYCSYHPHTRDEAINKAISIVKQLAEEYSHRTEDLVIDDSLRTIDVSELLGEQEQVNDFCEWKFTKSVADGGYFYSSGCNHKRFSDLHSFEYCPYCGKKIKIAPYQPKGE